MSVNKYNSTTGELERIAGGTLYADAPVGSIQAYGGTTAPSGWLLCQGQAVSRIEYSELFATIGTAFGAGNGSTTFNVPDLRETVPVGVGENGTVTIANHDIYTLGEFKDDQFQAFAIARGDDGGGSPSGYNLSPNNGNQTGNSGFYNKTTTPIPATLNGDLPRTGTTTHGKQLGVNYIIKAKQTPIPADIQSAIEEQNSYSTEETYTGKRWIDGKPIYRKAIKTTSNISTEMVIFISSNLDKIIDYGGIGYFGTNRYRRSFPWLAGNYSCCINGWTAGGAVYYGLDGAGSIALMSGSEIWFEYTKAE